MIPTLLLLVAPIPLAFAGPVAPREPTVCYPREWGWQTHVENLNDCQQAIDAIIQLDNSGSLTLGPGPKKKIKVVKGSCGISIHSKVNTDIRINVATLAWEATAYVFNPCMAAQGLHGRWISEDERYAISSYPYAVDGKRSIEMEERDAAVGATQCESPPQGFSAPNADDCHRVIDFYSQYSPTGYIEFGWRACLMKKVGTCVGWLCNERYDSNRLNEATAAWELTAGPFNNCIVRGLLGTWKSENGEASAKLIRTGMYPAAEDGWWEVVPQAPPNWK